MLRYAPLCVDLRYNVTMPDDNTNDNTNSSNNSYNANDDSNNDNNSNNKCNNEHNHNEHDNTTTTTTTDNNINNDNNSKYINNNNDNNHARCLAALCTSLCRLVSQRNYGLCRPQSARRGGLRILFCFTIIIINSSSSSSSIISVIISRIISSINMSGQHGLIRVLALMSYVRQL